jgi:hypothetical protein
VRGGKVSAAIPTDALAYLAEIPTLERVDLSAHTALTDNDVTFLERMPQLTAVAFARWGHVGDRGVAVLAGKPRLSRVSLGPGLTDAGVEKLRDFPALVEPGAADSLLSISSARTLTDRALAAIGALQGLAGLDVHTSVWRLRGLAKPARHRAEAIRAHREVAAYRPAEQQQRRLTCNGWRAWGPNNRAPSSRADSF